MSRLHLFKELIVIELLTDYCKGKKRKIISELKSVQFLNLPSDDIRV